MFIESSPAKTLDPLPPKYVPCPWGACKIEPFWGRAFEISIEIDPLCVFGTLEKINGDWVVSRDAPVQTRLERITNLEEITAWVKEQIPSWIEQDPSMFLRARHHRLCSQIIRAENAIEELKDTLTHYEKDLITLQQELEQVTQQLVPG